MIGGLQGLAQAPRDRMTGWALYQMMRSALTAAAFSLFYVSMYPVLTGGGVIYHYPYWPPPLAATYVLMGILLQAWFCFGRTRVERRPQALWPQVVTGILYAVVVLVFPGDIYQS